VKKTLALILDAGSERGMGHLYRQLHLGKLLKERGHSIQCFLPDYPPAIEKLRSENLSFEAIHIEDAIPMDWRTSFDIAVLDLLDTSTDFISMVREKAGFIVDFEDLGPGRNKVDLLIDANLTCEKSADVPSSVKTLFGLEFIALSPAFSQIHRNLEAPIQLEPVIISMGGVDSLNVTQKILQIVKSLKPNIDLTVIAGPGYPWLSRLEALRENLSFKLEHNVSNMAERLSKCGAVFCSGGIIMHEAMAAGAVPLIISLAEHQTSKALFAHEKGAAMFLGAAESFDESAIQTALKIKLDELKKMRREGNKLVDGKGIHRVASAIESLQ